MNTPELTPAHRIEDYDDPLFDPFATFDRAVGIVDVDDPYPRLQELYRAGSVQKGDIREKFGLERISLFATYESYMVLGYEAVADALRNSTKLSNGLIARFYEGTFGQSINGMDAPDHLRYRTLLQRAFLPAPLKIWGSELIPAVIGGLVQKFKRRGFAELVREFTSVYPFEVIYAQLGLPADDLRVFHKLASGLTCALIDFEHANEASRKLGRYFSNLLAERQGRCETDLITVLANAHVRGLKLPEDIVVAFLRQLMNAAGDTTYRGTGNLLVGLLTNPSQLHAVQSDHSLIPRAVEEALRWEAPLAVQHRLTIEDAALANDVIPANHKVDVLIGTANRDAQRFEEPDQFNIFRPPNRHMAFGYGPHLCLGQHLARIEMERALSILIDWLPNLRLDPDKPEPKITGLQARAPDAIHVLFDPPRS
jgi:cytochrome P450